MRSKITASSEHRFTGIDPIVLVWTGCLIGLTGVGVAILWLLRVDLHTLSPNSPNAAAALGAIELTAYAPALGFPARAVFVAFCAQPCGGG